ncbi:MAG: plasmid pRiA4b ORF-3 family protein [Arachnia sp.]
MDTNDNVIPFPGAPETRAAVSGSTPPDLAAFLAGLDLDFGPFAREQPKLLRKRPKRVAYVVRLDLDDVRPPIWRRLRLASDLMLDEVHDIIQTAMGWADCHLHHFVMGPDTRDLRRAHFLAPFDIEEGDEGIPESDVRLDQVLGKPGQRLFYEYDFGDGWWHTLKLEKVGSWVDGDPDASCVTGRRACPPEDLGGPGMVGTLAEWLAGNTDGYDPQWVRQVLDWLPAGYDPEAFSVDDVNAALTAEPLALADLPPVLTRLVVKLGPWGLPNVAGLLAAFAQGASLSDDDAREAVRRYPLLLEAIGDGVALTKAGYLPPCLVEELFEGLDLDDEWIGKGNREDMTPPVLHLRESATHLGLLRKSKGRLLPTANGRKLCYGPPQALLAHVASRLPLGRDHEQDAGTLALLFAAAERDWFQSRAEAAQLMADIGWRLDDGRMDLAVFEWARPTTTVLDSLCGRRADVTRRAAVARELLRLSV